MVLSKMYCSEQIVIPEKISNLLKTYAKAALKTQPYDLLRWSAAYFRCLSMDILPPVKPRYEQENTLGCLTKGYMKVLLSQLGKGFFVRRDILEHRWHELCLPEEELQKFLSLTRMLYWPQVHWLKMISVMVGSINPTFHDTIIMLFELLTDEAEGGSSPVPIWLFRECFKFLAELDCSAEQIFFDGRKVLPGNVLEDEMKMPNIPQKLSSSSFRNAVIDYWRYRIENDEKVESQHEKEADVDDSKIDAESIKKCTTLFAPSPSSSSSSSFLQCGSVFRIIGDFQDPKEVVEHSCDFDSILLVLQSIKYADNGEKFQLESHITERQRIKAMERDAEVMKMREQMVTATEENAKFVIEQECCELLKSIGAPWNWLHNFASHNLQTKSFNFLEKIDSDMTPCDDDDDERCEQAAMATSSDDSFDYLTEKFIMKSKSATHTRSQASPSASTIQSSTSTVSIIFNDNDNNVECTTKTTASNEHKVLVETICNISDAVERGDCNIRETTSIASILDAQHETKQLETVDYEKLKRFIDKAAECGLVFNDLNALYNYFIQESCQERFEQTNNEKSSSTGSSLKHHQHQKSENEDKEADVELKSVATSLPENVENTPTISTTASNVVDNNNVVSIFEESGIEVDNKLLDATVSDRMILGLVDKSQIEDNISDIVESSNASVSSLLSNAETVKMREVTREKDTQTMSYKDKVHEKRIRSQQQQERIGKSKSASFIKRQPFTCKIPPLTGISARMNDERIVRILKFLTHRSYQQGGFVYPRNLLEDECPNLME